MYIKNMFDVISFRSVTILLLSRTVTKFLQDLLCTGKVDFNFEG
jgi:hypothetical protein